ncbi:MAG: small-conductance mechanosensitive channel [Roseivirga sp.]|jgi:small-conductance mechanosensitive channel
MKNIRNFFELELFLIGDWELRIINIVWVALIFLITYVLLWLFKKYLQRQERVKRIDSGKSYAVRQVVAYIAYVIALISAVDSLGFQITVLLASSTALLVGLGLGLQDLFKDMVAGFIILFERTVTAGDVVEITGIVGEVKEVGLRTTSLLTREEIILIVPNSRLTAENVVNWSQNKKTTRFKIDVGVAYGSDTRLVQKMLIEAAMKSPEVLNKPEPSVIFSDFGESSLNFSLLFFSKNLFRIERTKSDIRFEIDRLFRENKISIPFPQRDIWFKNQAPDTSL